MAFGRGARHNGDSREEREGIKRSTIESTTRSMRLEGGRKIESRKKRVIGHCCGERQRGGVMWVCACV